MSAVSTNQNIQSSLILIDFHLKKISVNNNPISHLIRKIYQTTNFSVYAPQDIYTILFQFFSALGSFLEEVQDVNLSTSMHSYCCWMIFFAFSSLMCSTYILISMTFERFYSITRPLKAVTFNTTKKARIIIVCIYFITFAFCIPILFVATNDGDFCIINRYASETVLGEMYHWLTEILTFIFPFVALLSMNIVIIHTLRKRSLLKLLESTEGQNSKTKHSEKQVYTMLLLVTFVFLILNVPLRAVVYYLNFASGDTSIFYVGLHLFYQIGDTSYVTNHGINFFLYVMSGKKFRTDLRNLFFSKKP